MHAEKSIEMMILLDGNMSILPLEDNRSTIYGMGVHKPIVASSSSGEPSFTDIVSLTSGIARLRFPKRVRSLF